MLSSKAQSGTVDSREENTDSLLWNLAGRFTKILGEGDTVAMKAFLPEDFMLQLMDDYFLGKKNLLRVMKDSAMHKSFSFLLQQDASAVTFFADNPQSAGINSGICFTDSAMNDRIEASHSFATCIILFRLNGKEWNLQMIHLDIHCRLCEQ